MAPVFYDLSIVIASKLAIFIVPIEISFDQHHVNCNSLNIPSIPPDPHFRIISEWAFV